MADIVMDAFLEAPSHAWLNLSASGSLCKLLPGYGQIAVSSAASAARGHVRLRS